MHFRDASVAPIMLALVSAIKEGGTVDDVLERTDGKRSMVEASLHLLDLHGVVVYSESPPQVNLSTTSVPEFVAELSGRKAGDIGELGEVLLLGTGCAVSLACEQLSAVGLTGTVLNFTDSSPDCPSGWKSASPALIREGFQESVAACRLLVTALDRVWHPMLSHVNNAVLSGSTNWLPILVQGQRAIVGPTVVPRRSACYCCFELRQRANLDERDVYEAFSSSQSLDHVPPASTLFKPFVDLVITQASLEALKIVSGAFSPQTLGYLLEMDLTTSIVERQPVLKLPRCEACGPARPSTIPWDFSLEQSNVQ